MRKKSRRASPSTEDSSTFRTRACGFIFALVDVERGSVALVQPSSLTRRRESRRRGSSHRAPFRRARRASTRSRGSIAEHLDERLRPVRSFDEPRDRARTRRCPEIEDALGRATPPRERLARGVLGSSLDLERSAGATARPRLRAAT
jgi:hypothetical protein